MAVFSYQAIDARARVIRGSLPGDSLRDARDRLRARGLIVESIAERKQSAQAKWNPLARASRHSAKLAMTVRDLSTLLSTGIGLVEALGTVTEQHRGAFQLSLIALRDQVAGGTSLSDAMQANPAIFDELTVHMVRVGENAGNLDAVLDQLADFRERYLLFKDRITTALIYPAIVITMAVSVSAFLMTVVLPMLLENLIDSGRPLPFPTRVLKALSDLAVVHGLWLLLLTTGAVGALVALSRIRRGKRVWHRIVFMLPVLGNLAKKQEIARVALIVSTLMKNGIVFVEAAQIAGRATKNLLLKEALDAMRDRVQSGREIGDALAVSGIFPPLVIQIFSVGQQTGSLEEMLDRLSVGYERQVANATSRLTAALEPILIVFLAIVVGFILFATILPILEAGNVL